MSDTITVDVEVTLLCSECGDELTVYASRYAEIRLDPCERCLGAAKEEGYECGKDEAGS